MRYVCVPATAIAALLIHVWPADAAAITSMHCETYDLGRFDTAAIHSLFEHWGSPAWQPENRACSLYSAGLIYQLVDDRKNAIAAFTDAIGWQNNFSEAYAARGDVYVSLGEYEKAHADYAQAWRLNYENAVALNNICWERAKRGYPLNRALDDCDSAIKLQPDLWAAWDSRCLVNYRLGNYAAAVSDCDKAMGLWHDETWDMQLAPSLRGRTQYVLGLAKIKIGKVDGGNADIAAAKDAYPGVEKKYAGFGITP